MYMWMTGDDFKIEALLTWLAVFWTAASGPV